MEVPRSERSSHIDLLHKLLQAGLHSSTISETQEEHFCYINKKIMSAQPARIGIFGGTFDPIHLGHLILAEAAFEELALDRLIFIPAKISPYKTHLPPAASAKDRLAMIELAIRGRGDWSVDARELLRTGSSFTIDTVRELQQEYLQAQLYLFIGEDQLAGLNGWKESELLQQIVSFVIFSRDAKHQQKLIEEKIIPKQALFLNRFIDISSTEVRERLAKNRNVDYLLTQTIHDYIKEKKLYQKNSS